MDTSEEWNRENRKQDPHVLGEKDKPSFKTMWIRE